jgi:hypothetical protein
MSTCFPFAYRAIAGAIESSRLQNSRTSDLLTAARTGALTAEDPGAAAERSKLAPRIRPAMSGRKLHEPWIFRTGMLPGHREAVVGDAETLL